GVENVEVACGIPMMMQGYNLEDVTPGVDEMQIRQPLGAVAAITPFNFPAMIVCWFLPSAIACGNTFILKPSERAPRSICRDFELATQIISDSASGCAGQRCLAVSVAVTVGEAQKNFRDSIAHAASSIRVGNGLDAGVQMGPVISKESKQRIESLISTGVGEGAKPILDGRNTKISKYEAGNFLTPTILDGVSSTSQLAHTEIFGPVLSLIHANSIDEAMEFLRRSPYGNQASLFTTSGSAARRFRYDAPAGTIGTKIGVPAPLAYFPFSGRTDSLYGILHG